MEEIKKGLEKQQKDLDTFAKNLESDFSNFGNNEEKKDKKDENNGSTKSSGGYTIRTLLELAGESFLDYISKVPDQYFFKIAINGYSEEVQKICDVKPSFNGTLAKIQTDSFKRVLAKYNWDIDVEISEEAVLAVSTFARFFGAYYEGKKVCEKIQADLETLKKAKEQKNAEN